MFKGTKVSLSQRSLDIVSELFYGPFEVGYINDSAYVKQAKRKKLRFRHKEI